MSGTASKVKRAPSGTGSSYKIEELYNIEVMIFRKRVTGKFKELYKIEELIIGERGARFARIRFI